MKPTILITGNMPVFQERPSYQIARTYSKGISDAGGIPLLVLSNDCAKDYAQMADALLLSGGVDVHPTFYGQEPATDTLFTNIERDHLEQDLLKQFVKLKKPVLGICRGIQFINVFFGGTLYQDISDMPGGDHTKGVQHPVDIVENSLLHQILGGSIMANSYHHQAVERLAPGLTATAFDRKENGSFLEAFEHNTLPVLGVQWHPERMITTEEITSGLTDMRPLFQWLITAAETA